MADTERTRHKQGRRDIRKENRELYRVPRERDIVKKVERQEDRKFTGNVEDGIFSREQVEQGDDETAASCQTTKIQLIESDQAPDRRHINNI